MIEVVDQSKKSVTSSNKKSKKNKEKKKSKTSKKKRNSLLYEFSRGNQVDGWPRVYICKLYQKEKEQSAQIDDSLRLKLKDDEKSVF